MKKPGRREEQEDEQEITGRGNERYGRKGKKKIGNKRKRLEREGEKGG